MIILDYLNVITRGLIRGRQEGQGQIRTCDDRSRDWTDTTAGRGRKSENTGDLEQLGKARNGFLSLQKECNATDQFWTCDLQYWVVISKTVLKPLGLW